MALQRLGEFEAATDLTNAFNIRQTGSESQTAVDERVVDQAAPIILANATQIIEAAVELAQDDAGLVRTTDDRLPSFGPTEVEEEELAEAHLDAAGKLYWNSVRKSDGGPTVHGVEILKARLGLDGSGTDPLAAGWLLETVGVAPSRSLYINSLKLGGRVEVATTGDPRDAVIVGNEVHFTTNSGRKVFDIPTRATVDALPRPMALTGAGDSLTANGVYLSRVEAVTGWTTTNLGVSGNTSTEVAIRQGGVRPLLTVTGDQIPATGSVAVTTVDPGSSFRGAGTTSGAFSWPGTLAGVPGTFIHHSELSPVTREFVRDTAGTAVACPPGTPFYGTDGDAHRDEIQVIWVGRNNILNPADVIRDVAAMVAHLTPYVKRYIVMGVTNGTNEPFGSANYNAVIAINQQLADIYGERFLDIRRYLIDQAQADLGQTPTPEDLTAISEDRIPPQLHIDSIHFTTAGYTAVGNRTVTKLTGLGWY